MVGKESHVLYMSREVPQKREADVDKEIGTAACNAVDAHGWDCRGLSADFHAMRRAAMIGDLRKMVRSTRRMVDTTSIVTVAFSICGLVVDVLRSVVCEDIGVLGIVDVVVCSSAVTVMARAE